MRQNRNLDHPGLISGFLVLLAAAAYVPAIYLGFINYDDPLYVTGNPNVQGGLTWAGLRWAFIQFHAANWHPLTWLSHMLDCQLYGLRPLGHHFTNFLFHAANTVVLFLWLRSLTGACWRSAFVAALFALHPLHVESVAWIAERKDVLSAFFGLLSLWAYTRYGQKSEIRNPKSEGNPKPEGLINTMAGRGDACGMSAGVWYGASLSLFALGLMSKPMLVTWPFVMLLLDYWPLRRTAGRWVLRMVEKLPFFALSAASCAVTVWAQKAGEAVVSLQTLPLEQRCVNGLVGCLRYAGKMLRPTDLAVFYPSPAGPPAWGLAGIALLLLTTLGLVALWQRKQRPYLLLGLAWFIGTLVPVIGLVQVGNQSIADRYTYLPAIGLFIIVAWGAAELEGIGGRVRWAVVGAASASLVACALATGRQLLYWQNSETLFRHALAVTKDNFVAWNNLGFFLAEHRDLRGAESCYRAATIANASFEDAWYNLGCALADLNRNQEAVTAFENALRLKPQLVKLRNNLAVALAAEGRMEEAKGHLRKAASLDPKSADPHSNLGTLLARESKWAEAAAEFNRALALEPGLSEARLGLSGVLAKQGNYDQSVLELSILLKREPTNAPARLQLAGILALQGKPDLALKEYSELLRANPQDSVAHSRLAAMLARQGKTPEAIVHYRAALDARPNFPVALNNLAWILATHPDAQYRNGPEALRLAEHACRLAASEEAFMVGTLAAAYAEAGRFAEAVSAAEKARTLAEQANDQELAAKTGNLLELYRAGRPYRDLP